MLKALSRHLKSPATRLQHTVISETSELYYLITLCIILLLYTILFSNEEYPIEHPEYDLAMTHFISQILVFKKDTITLCQLNAFDKNYIYFSIRYIGDA